MTASPIILYSSDTLIAVDKPAGIIVHGDGTGARTLTDELRGLVAAGRCPAISPGRAKELQALQRLDRETSGIVLFSTCKRTQAAYDQLIAERGIEKRYLAIACGNIPWNERSLSWQIGRDRHDAHRMRVSRTGKPARTHVFVMDRRRQNASWITLVDVSLETGRRHQIRVHLAHAGFPLMGDDLYGKADARGLMLHAHRLEFDDPLNGHHVRITASVPKRMSSLFPRALGTSQVIER